MLSNALEDLMLEKFLKAFFSSFSAFRSDQNVDALQLWKTPEQLFQQRFPNKPCCPCKQSIDLFQNENLRNISIEVKVDESRF